MPSFLLCWGSSSRSRSRSQAVVRGVCDTVSYRQLLFEREQSDRKTYLLPSEWESRKRGRERVRVNEREMDRDRGERNLSLSLFFCALCDLACPLCARGTSCEHIGVHTWRRSHTHASWPSLMHFNLNWLHVHLHKLYTDMSALFSHWNYGAMQDQKALVTISPKCNNGHKNILNLKSVPRWNYAI